MFNSCSPGNPYVKFRLRMFSCWLGCVQARKVSPHRTNTKKDSCFLIMLVFLKVSCFLVLLGFFFHFFFPNPPLAYGKGPVCWREPARTRGLHRGGGKALFQRSASHRHPRAESRWRLRARGVAGCGIASHCN